MTSPAPDYIPLSGGNNGALTDMNSTYKSPLPILVLITESEITHSHTDKTAVNAYLVAKTRSNYSLKNVKKATALTAHMRIRGQSTGGAAKAQYSFSLDTDPAEPLMGMPFGGKHWVLNDIGVQDYSLLRDPLAFYLQRELGGVHDAEKGELNCWAPRHKYCQLFVYQKSSTNTKSDSKILADIIATPNLATGGGFYRGLYLLLEKIHPQKSRVHTKIKDKPGDSPHTETGGLMFQINPPSTFTTTQGGTGNWYLPLAAFPNFATEPNNLYQPKAHYFYGFNNQTNQNQQHTTLMGLINTWWSDWIASDFTSTCDHHSFAVYFLVNEIANDPDGYHKSTFMYKKVVKKDDKKMHAGPLWDKDKSFGNPNNVFTGESGWNYVRDNPPMWTHLLGDSQFCSKVWELWQKNPLLFDTKDRAAASSNADTTDSSSTKALWKTFLSNQKNLLAKGTIVDDNGSLWGTPANSTAWQSQVSTLHTAVEDRITWIDNNLLTLLEKSGFKPAS